MMLASHHEDIAEMRTHNERTIASNREENAAILANNARIMASHREENAAAMANHTRIMASHHEENAAILAHNARIIAATHEDIAEMRATSAHIVAATHEEIAEMRASSARIIAATHEDIAEMRATSARIIAANREDIAEMRASNARTDRQLLEMQQQAAMDREQAEKERQEIEKDRQRGEKERKEFNRQLAGISDRLGSLIEDMVAPNAPRIARTLFDGDEVLTSSIRVKRRHPSDPGLNIELDLLVVGRRHLLVGEAKSKVTVEKAVAFLEKMRSIPEYFPEFSGFTVLPLIASVGIESSLVAHLSRLHIYALAFGDETMEILNEGAF